MALCFSAACQCLLPLRTQSFYSGCESFKNISENCLQLVKRPKSKGVIQTHVVIQGFLVGEKKAFKIKNKLVITRLHSQLPINYHRKTVKQILPWFEFKESFSSLSCGLSVPYLKHKVNTWHRFDPPRAQRCQSRSVTSVRAGWSSAWVSWFHVPTLIRYGRVRDGELAVLLSTPLLLWCNPFSYIGGLLLIGRAGGREIKSISMATGFSFWLFSM